MISQTIKIIWKNNILLIKNGGISISKSASYNVRALFFFSPGNIVTVNIKLNVVEVHHSNDLSWKINVKTKKTEKVVQRDPIY